MVIKKTKLNWGRLGFSNKEEEEFMQSSSLLSNWDFIPLQLQMFVLLQSIRITPYL